MIKQDFDLIKEILSRAEELHYSTEQKAYFIKILGYDGEEVVSHIKLAIRDGLLSPGGKTQSPERNLTGKGQDFLVFATGDRYSEAMKEWFEQGLSLDFCYRKVESAIFS